MDAAMLKQLSATLIDPITNIIKLSISQGKFTDIQKSLLFQYSKVQIPHPVFAGLSASYLRVSKVAEKMAAE